MTDKPGFADASFSDGGEQPLRLRALDGEDLAVVSALVQDAVLSASEVRWDRKARRFALLVNRFRWEDAARAEARGRAFERVRSVLVVEDVLAVRSSGVSREDPDLVLSLLSVEFAPGADGGGEIVLILAGDGAISLTVEALEVVLRDVTRPYEAPSGRAPGHAE